MILGYLFTSDSFDRQVDHRMLLMRLVAMLTAVCITSQEFHNSVYGDNGVNDDDRNDDGGNEDGAAEKVVKGWEWVAECGKGERGRGADAKDSQHFV